MSTPTTWARCVFDAVEARKTIGRRRRLKRICTSKLDEVVTILRTHFCQAAAASSSQPAKSSSSRLLLRDHAKLLNPCSGQTCLLATPIADVRRFLLDYPLSTAPSCIVDWRESISDAWKQFQKRLRSHPDVDRTWFRNHDEAYAQRVLATITIGTMDTDELWQCAGLEQCDLPPPLASLQRAVQTSHNHRRRGVDDKPDTERDLHNDHQEKSEASQARGAPPLHHAVQYMADEERRVRKEWQEVCDRHTLLMAKVRLCEPFSPDYITREMKSCTEQIDRHARDPCTWKEDLVAQTGRWKEDMADFLKDLRTCVLPAPSHTADQIKATVTRCATNHLAAPVDPFILPDDGSPDVAERLRSRYTSLCTKLIHKLIQTRIDPDVRKFLRALEGARGSDVHRAALVEQLEHLRGVCHVWMGALAPLADAIPEAYTRYTEHQVDRAYWEELRAAKKRMWELCFRDITNKRAIKQMLEEAERHNDTTPHAWSSESKLRRLMAQCGLDLGLSQTSLVAPNHTAGDIMQGFTDDMELIHQHWDAWNRACQEERPRHPFLPVLTRDAVYLDWYLDDETWQRYRSLLLAEFHTWRQQADQLDRVHLAASERCLKAALPPTMLDLARAHFQLVHLELSRHSADVL